MVSRRLHHPTNGNSLQKMSLSIYACYHWETNALSSIFFVFISSLFLVVSLCWLSWCTSCHFLGLAFIGFGAPNFANKVAIDPKTLIMHYMLTPRWWGWVSTKGHAIATVGLQQSLSTYKTQHVSFYVHQFLSSPPKVAPSPKILLCTINKKERPKHTIITQLKLCHLRLHCEDIFQGSNITHKEVASIMDILCKVVNTF